MTDKSLLKPQYDLLITIINCNKCFDRRDNNFLLSNRKIARWINCSPSKVDQLFRILRDRDLVRYKQVTEHQRQNYCRMLDPSFLFISYNRSDYWLTLAIYHLDNLEKVNNWRNTCINLNSVIHPLTGELLSISYSKIRSFANKYSKFDRCYRKGLFIENGYHLDVEMPDPLNERDLAWFKMVNLHCKL